MIGVGAGIATIIGVPIAAAALWHSYQQDAKPADAAAHITTCRKDHHVPVSRRFGTGENRSEAFFADCVWPPAEGTTAADGYYEIRVTDVSIPGANNNQPVTAGHFFEADCEAVLFQYGFNHMVLKERPGPLVVVKNGSTVDMDGKPATIPFELETELHRLKDPPEGDLVVLASDRYDLSTARCEHRDKLPVVIGGN